MPRLLALGRGNPLRRGWAFLKRCDWPLIPVVGLILGAGLIMQWSIAGAEELPMGHLIRMAAVAVFAVWAALVPARRWRMLAWPFYLATVAGLVYVLFAGDGTNHSNRWVRLAGSFKLQPSEFLKIALILLLAKWFADRPRPRGFGDLLLPMTLCAVPAVLILLEPDLGTALTTAPTFFALAWLAGTPWRTLRWLVLIPLLSAPVAFLSIHDYQRERVMTWWNQDSLSQEEIADAGYHLWHAKLAIGEGGLTGQGWGKGPENRLDRLPERHNDFIFPVIAEEFGFVGAVAFLLMYSLLPVLAWVRAMRYRDPFPRMVVAGIGVHFAVHLLVNTGVSCGVWPTTGLPLLMVSWGGSSMAVSGLALGLALAVGAAPEPVFLRREWRG